MGTVGTPGTAATAPDEPARPVKSWETLYQQWYQRIGRPPFAPEFFTAQLAIMGDETRDIDERTLAWARYRAWGSYNEYCCRGKGDLRHLTQRDCALDLAHLAAGRRVEWIDEARARSSHELADVTTLDKSCISRSFQRNKDSFLIDLQGQKIYPTVDPATAAEAAAAEAKAANQENPRAKFSGVGNLYAQFLELPEVAHSREFQEWTVARARAIELGKVVLGRYREWRRAERRRGMDIPHADKNLEEAEEAKTSPPPPPPLPVRRKTAAAAAAGINRPAGNGKPNAPAAAPPSIAAEIAPVSEAFDRLAGPVEDARVKTFLMECRQQSADVTAPEIVALMEQKATSINPKTTSPVGLLLATVPALCAGATLARVRKSIERQGEAQARAIEQQREALQEWAAEARAVLADPQRADDHQSARDQLAEIERRLTDLEPSQ